MQSASTSLRALVPFVVATSLAAQGYVDTTVAAGLGAITTDVTTFGSHSRGAATADFDLDGDLDLILLGNGSSPIRYFENDGTATFTDRTAQANLPDSGTAISLGAGDYDNDGDPDLYIGCMTSDFFYENDGTGTFIDRTSLIANGSPGPTYCASFGDYDNDGWADISIGVWDPVRPNLLLRNLGGNAFQNVALQAGTSTVGMTFVSAWMDYNEDGLLDIYVANDKGMNLTPNQLFHNNGNGTFTDVAPALGADAAIFSMGFDFVDAFNDGNWDIYVTDAAPDHLFLAWEPAAGGYVERHYDYGMEGGIFHTGWGCQFFDYDNDGWQDLYYVDEDQPNPLYHNPGTPASQFVDWPNETQTVGLGATRNQSAMLVADWDNDGRMDVLQIYRDGPNANNAFELRMNQLANTGNWIKFRTVGTQSNRDGWGARIELRTGGVTQRQMVRSGVGLAGSPDPRVHFGLGTATTIDRVDVTWPSGQRQTLRNVPVNQILELREPNLTYQGSPTIGTTSTFSIDSMTDGGLAYALPLSITPGVTPLVDGRVIPIVFDAITNASLNFNSVTPNGVGILPTNGLKDVSFHVPNDPTLTGFTLYATALILDLQEPTLVRTTFPGYTIVVN